MADDGDWSTTLRWARQRPAASRVTIGWHVPRDATPGPHRLVYHGDARTITGRISAFTGATAPFIVTGENR